MAVVLVHIMEKESNSQFFLHIRIDNLHKLPRYERAIHYTTSRGAWLFGARKAARIRMVRLLARVRQTAGLVCLAGVTLLLLSSSSGGADTLITACYVRILNAPRSRTQNCPTSLCRRATFLASWVGIRGVVLVIVVKRRFGSSSRANTDKL